MARLRRRPRRGQPLDERIEQVDEQQADDERPDGVARHPQQQAQDEPGDDQQDDPRRQRGEGRGLAGDVRTDERRRRDAGRASALRGGRTGSGGLVHRAADYQTWSPAQPSRPSRARSPRSSRASAGG